MRKINDNMNYLVFEPIEYDHIKTVIDNLMYDADQYDKAELQYVYNALTNAYCNFIHNDDLKGGEGDENDK